MDNQQRKEQIIEAYEFRHACKEFDADKKISDEDFRFILETGRLSPSSFGYEPWKFVVLQNPEIREELRAVSWGAQRTLPTASHFVLILSRTAAEVRFDSEYFRHMDTEVYGYPAEMAAGKHKFLRIFQESDFKLLDNERFLADWSAKQSYIPLGNMMTAAAQIGIDSCPIEGFDMEKADAVLAKHGITEDGKFSLAVMVAFGYRVQEQKRGKVRRSMDEVAQWVY